MICKVPLNATANMTATKLKRFEDRSGTNPPTLQFDYKPVVYEATSARGASARAWWDGICQMAKDKESSFGLGFGSLMEYNGLAYAWLDQTFKRHWAPGYECRLASCIGPIWQVLIGYMSYPTPKVERRHHAAGGPYNSG